LVAQTSRKRPTTDPDLVLKRAMGALSTEVSRLRKIQDARVCCPECGIEPGLSERERSWLAQAVRDLTRLALGARKMLLERLLRNLSAAGLDAVEAAGSDGKWLPE
jgi:hypothetical protein